MTNKIFSDFGSTVSIAGSDIIPFQRGTGDSAIYRYMTATQLAAFIGSAGAVWGYITGDISEQADLQAEFDLKAPINNAALTGNTSAVNLTVTNPIAGSITGNAATVTTIPTLSGEVTNSGNAVTLVNSAVIGKVLTGYVSGAGTVAATDTILQAVQKLNGNAALLAPLASPTFTGTVTLPAGQVVNGVTLVSGGSTSLFLAQDGTYRSVAGGGGTVTSVSVVTANGVSGSVADATTTPAITLTLGAITPSSVNALTLTAQTNGFTIAGGTTPATLTVAANANVAGTNTGDVTIGTANGLSLVGQAISLGRASDAAFGAVQVDGTTITATNGVISAVSGGAGTVTTVSVVTANGFAGSVADASTTPAITLTTSVTGMLKGNGTAISAATAGVDYSAGTSALATGILKSTTTTGALTIAVAGDFPTLNQNTTGNAATATALLNARTIGGVSFDGTANITVASATGGFTVSGGDLVLGANNITMTGSLAATGSRVTKGWFTDIESTNAPTIGGTSATGSGGLVRATSPTLVTPVLGAATATSINGLTLTSSTGVLTIANSKTLTMSNTLTFTGTDSSSIALGAGGTVAYLGTVQAYSKQQTLTPVVLTSTSNSIAWNANDGNNARHTATENTTLANPTNLVAGTVYTFQFTQDSTPRTLAFGTVWKFAGDSTVDTASGAVNIITGLYDGTNINCVMTGPFS